MHFADYENIFLAAAAISSGFHYFYALIHCVGIRAPGSHDTSNPPKIQSKSGLINSGPAFEAWVKVISRVLAQMPPTFRCALSFHIHRSSAFYDQLGNTPGKNGFA